MAKKTMLPKTDLRPEKPRPTGRKPWGQEHPWKVILRGPARGLPPTKRIAMQKRSTRCSKCRRFFEDKHCLSENELCPVCA